MTHRRGVRSRLLTSVFAVLVTTGLIASGATAAVALEPVTVTAAPTPPASAVEVHPDRETAAPGNPDAPTVPTAPTGPTGPAVDARALRAPESLTPAAVEPQTVEFYYGGEPRQAAVTPGAAGFVTFTGTIVDAATSVPLQGATVAVYGDEGAAQTATTDRAGAFTLQVLPGNGYHMLEVASPANATYVGNYVDIMRAERGSSLELGALELKLGARLSGTLTMPAAPAGMLPASVNIVDAEGKYVGGWSANAPSAGDADWSAIVEPGIYRVSFAQERSFYQEQWWKQASTLETATPIDAVAGARVNDLDATLELTGGSISGTVRDDRGAPLANVSVMASGSMAPSYGQTVTDAQGRYFIAGLQAGTYTVQFWPNRDDLVSSYYGGPDYERATPISIATGAASARTGIDGALRSAGVIAGILPEQAAAHITSVSAHSTSGFGSHYGRLAADGSFRIGGLASGTYQFTYSLGSGSYEYGAPLTVIEGQTRNIDLTGLVIDVATLQVSLDLDGISSGSLELIDPRTHDVVTTLSVSGPVWSGSVVAGTYLFRFTSWSHGQATYYYGGNSLSTATEVTLASGGTVAIMFASGSATVEGVVTDAADGRALAGLTVQLYRADSTSTPIATTLTDADGGYAFGRLGANNYAVKVVGGEQLFIDRWFSAGGSSEPTAITLDDSGSFGSADVAMVLGGGIDFTFDDPRVQASSYVNLTLAATDGTHTAFHGPSVNSRFELRGVAAGTYTVSLRLNSSDYTLAAPVVVTAGEVADVAAVLPPAQISGTVTGPTGLPAYVNVIATWTQEAPWGSDPQQSWAYTDPSTGYYDFTTLPVGAEVTLEFVPMDRRMNIAAEWWDDARDVTEASLITVGAQGSGGFVADAQLSPGVPITGHIVDALTDEPLQGVSVGGSVPTAVDGSFTVYANRLGETPLRVESSRTHVGTDLTLTVPAEGLTGVEIALQRGYTISGTVAAANNGSPIRNAWVSLHDAADQWRGSSAGLSTWDDSFTTTALAPGTYKLRAENYGGLYVAQWWDGAADFDNAQTITIVDQHITDVDVRMTLGGTVSGRIVDEHGQPITGATVGVATAPERGIARLFSSFGQLFSGGSTESPILDIETRTGPDGTFRLPALEPGSYTLYIYSEQFGTVWYDNKATREEADIITITAGATQSLGGDVSIPPLEEGAQPLRPEQTLSTAFDIVTHPADRTVDEAGTVQFTALASGSPLPTVQWQRFDGDAWGDLAGETNTMLFLVPALADHGAQYRAVFTQGDDTLTTDAATLTVVAAPKAPSAPATPTVKDVSTTRATIAWSAPADNGRPITGYDVVLRAGDAAPRTVSVGAVTEVVVRGLQPGTDYTVTVAAKNQVGAGAASAAASVRTLAQTAPAAPSGVTATATSATSLTVGWMAVEGTDVAPLTGYRVELLAGGETVRTTDILSVNTTSTSLTQLDPETDYQVRVLALGVGSTGSALVAVRTPALPPVITVPNAPAGLQVTSVSPDGIEVAWEAPAVTGNSPITGYTVTVTRAGAPIGNPLALGADVRTAKITGLAPATAYTVRVAAINIAGAGAPSSVDAETTQKAPQIAFTDTWPGALFHDEVMWTAQAGISQGWLQSDGTRVFRGGEPVLRDQMAAFLYRLAGSPAYEPPPVSPFVDVSPDYVFYKEIAWLAEEGISEGWLESDGSRTYRPHTHVLRDVMAAFLHRFAAAHEYVAPSDSPFRDIAPSTPFYREMSWLAEAGVSTGWVEPSGKPTYRPYQPVTREQMAAFMYRLTHNPR